MRHRPFTLADLVDGGTLASGVDAVLAALVAARANLLISGATGTGKTTLLSTLLSLVDPAERIVCIEESGELAPQHPHVIRLLVRRANVEGAGEITLTDLVRESLRMRPDRVVLGECRGPEVREVLGALNTGHDGGATTVHANAAQDIPARLEALGALAGMTREAVAAQAVSALHAVIHLRRVGGRRRVTEVAVVGRDPGSGTLTVEPAVLSPPGGAATAGPGWSRLADRIGWRTR
ncbi:ATPase, T2SS/T4P/T4SS family [Cellulomonas denverensis]|uniref:ATPase, T2SS/T4P/T4SS family n=1 Tax=Cellulomonas denverensis TaxID=264297 RepID=UPI0035EA3CEA